MSSEVIFFSEVSQAIGQVGQAIGKSRNDVTYTNFNIKAVGVTEVIEKVNSTSQVVRIIDGDDQLKKHDVPNNSRYRFAAFNQEHLTIHIQSWQIARK